MNTPDDPEFDRCENDNEEEATECRPYFNEELRAIGFNPDSATRARAGSSSTGLAACGGTRAVVDRTDRVRKCEKVRAPAAEPRRKRP